MSNFILPCLDEFSLKNKAGGQVLAYSGFYPEHHKRIHLFGKSDEAVICTAMGICLELDIVMTFEEVEK
jgi:hypothetical protein